MCQFASRLLQVGFGQTSEAGFQVVRVDGVDVTIDLPCLCLSEGEAAITEREGEGVFFHAVSLQADGLVALQAVTVHPLSHAQGGTQEHPCDLATRCLEAVELSAPTEANANGARDRIGGHSADGGAAEGERFEHHRVSCELESV